MLYYLHHNMPSDGYQMRPNYKHGNTINHHSTINCNNNNNKSEKNNRYCVPRNGCYCDVIMSKKKKIRLKYLNFYVLNYIFYKYTHCTVVTTGIGQNLFHYFTCLHESSSFTEKFFFIIIFNAVIYAVSFQFIMPRVARTVKSEFLATNIAVCILYKHFFFTTLSFFMTIKINYETPLYCVLNAH